MPRKPTDEHSIRRIAFDLTGLPPTPEAVEGFLADERPDEEAFDRLVDRFLASPYYGERWGRHWLDAAGYFDVIATDNDAGIIDEREGNWKYRDWVVRALNRDMPFDQFLLEQIAGDELVDWRNAARLTSEMQDSLIATGFLRQAPDVTYAPELNTADIRHQVIYDTVQTIGTNLLGLTLQCCQCHDHKFDPLPQQDYFRFAAIFSPAYDVHNWKHSKERFLPDVSPSEKKTIDDHNVEIDRRIGETQTAISEVKRPFATAVVESKTATIPENIRGDLQAAVAAPADQRSDVQKYLAEKLGSFLTASDAEINSKLDDTAKSKLSELQKTVSELPRGKKSYGKIQAIWDMTSGRTNYLYRRGDYTQPGESVNAGAISVLSPTGQSADFPVVTANSATSGNRTQFARWLTRRDHPLTARVFVNRVWQQFFGRGIVATPDNFGASGAAPTHPELLDYLASEFMMSDWSRKRLQRQILNSSAYRQTARRMASEHDGQQAAPAKVDAENRLLWRMPIRRLESEVIRDSVLAVTGILNSTMGGPPVPLKAQPNGSVEIDIAKCASPSDPFRRSMYILCRRNYQLTELSTFDQPTSVINCTKCNSSAVVQQSLLMLNGKFAMDMAQRFASRILASNQTAEPIESITEIQRRELIDRAFQSAVARSPAPEEMQVCLEHWQQQVERYRTSSNSEPRAAIESAFVDLCQVILNTSEFLYIE